MRLSIFKPLIICLLTQWTFIGAVSLSDRLPKEESICISRLNNGIRTFIQQKASSSIALKVVWKSASGKPVIRSLEGPFENGESIEAFLRYCSEMILETAGSKMINHKKNAVFSGDAIAIIAVGECIHSGVQVAIDNVFSSLTFLPKEEMALSNPIEIGVSDTSKVSLSIQFASPKNALSTYADLKQDWREALLQELFQQRMERCTRALQQRWEHPHQVCIHTAEGAALSSEEKSVNVLSYLLWEIKQIKQEGFYDEELADIKNQLHRRLWLLESSPDLPNNSVLASYYAEQFLRGQECLVTQAFISASEEYIEEIKLSDLLCDMPQFLADDNRSIKILFPRPSSKELTVLEVENVLKELDSLSDFKEKSVFLDEENEEPVLVKNEKKPQWKEENVSPLLLRDRAKINAAFSGERDVLDAATDDEGIVFSIPKETGAADGASQPAESVAVVFAKSLSRDGEKPSILRANSDLELFHQLHLSESDRGNIHSIISTVADKNIVELVFKKRELEKKGKKIDHVHPLRFIGYIIADHHLHKCLREIKNSSFKWDNVIGGFSKKMKEESSRNNIMMYVPGFSGMLDVDPNQVTAFIERHDWAGLVRFLIK